MSENIPERMHQVSSRVQEDGTLELRLAEVDVPEPAEHEVLVRVEAAPINPSDLGLLLAGADLDSVEVTGEGRDRVATARLPAGALRMARARIGEALPCGNEGAGVVVRTGSAEAARALEGRVVAILGGAMYGEYRCVPAAQCLPMPEGVRPEEAASCFVNPLTALGMVETMRLEGHTALVHTAAASNLGQMLNRICLADGIELVNIVRRPEQEALLREQGARHVCNSSADDFAETLTAALRDTGATIAFDAIGGGTLPGTILACMEAAVSEGAGFNRYGSNVHKQVYIYGGLDRGPTEIHRTFGMAWSVGGWLLPPFLERIGPAAAQKLRERVAAEIRTTFASQYSREVGLAEMLDREAIRTYGRQATGEKYLVRPQR